ncbi:MAG: folate-binding protein, partial [Gammaproteobacteria bacterium]|nr:folate-binding protein [Gammaproteobacteria bacterium]
MNSSWRDFISQRGASYSNDSNTVFSDKVTDPDNTNLIADLSYLGIIKISGEDSETFLQGQTSNDVRKVDDTQGQLGSYCSPKGRILATFHLLKQADGYYMILDKSLLEATLKRLRMFVLMS